MTREIRVCAVSELPPGQARLVEDGALRIAVFNVAEAYYAVDDACPHRRGPLSEGWMEGFLVACPWHGWQFDVRSGACVTLADRDVAAYPVRVADDTLYVTLPETAAGGAP